MKLILQHNVWQRIRAYVDNCQHEISGLGKLERDDDGNFVVSDVALFDQTVSASHSDITSDALAKFQYERHKAGDSLEDWCFWWHSHAAMEVFFSTRDTDTIAGSTEFPYLVSLVTNHRHALLARVDTLQHVHLHTDLEVEIAEDDNDDVVAACKAEIAEKVSTPPAPKVGYGTFNNTRMQANTRRYGFDDPLWDGTPTPHTPRTINIDEPDTGLTPLPTPTYQTMSLDEIKVGLDATNTVTFLDAFEDLESKILDWEEVLQEADNHPEESAHRQTAENKLLELSALYDTYSSRAKQLRATNPNNHR